MILGVSAKRKTLVFSGLPFFSKKEGKPAGPGVLVARSKCTKIARFSVVAAAILNMFTAPCQIAISARRAIS